MSRRSSAAPVAAYLLGIVTLVLVLAGLLMIYSASSVADYVKLGDSAHHLKRQLIYTVIGIAALLAASRLDLRLDRRHVGLLRNPAALAWGIWTLSVAGLIAVPFIGVGKWGAQRWIDAGIFNIQPSEFAKLGCVLVTAVVLTQWRAGTLNREETLKRLLGAVVPVIVLVILQPDMGTTVSIALAVLLLLWLGNVKGRVIALLVSAGAALGALMILVADYRVERYLAFLDPWGDPRGGGFQIIQSLYAFGTGGLAGVGLGMSRQKFFYLPAAHTDFIFAIIGEELGLLGSVGIVIAFMVFAYAGIRIALDAANTFDRLLAGGLTAMIAMQAAMNIAAVTGAMPVTGIPLPLVSYGGSSMIFTLACIGLVLGVARRSGRAVDRADTGHPRSRAVRVAAEHRSAEIGSRAAGQSIRGSERALPSEWRRDRRSRVSRIDGGATSRRRGA